MVRKIENRDSLPECSCGAVFTRIIDRPMVIGEIPSYHSPTDGRLITSRSERKADLARSKAIEWEPGIEKDIERRRKHLADEAFKPISDGIDNIVRDLNNAGKLETSDA
jgi:hypothetical protein